MATQVVRQRVESPARWAKAFERATTLGLEIFTIAGEDTFVVTLASKLDVVYRVTTTTCGCQAGLSGDPVCIHRAVARFVQGCLVTESHPVKRPCFWCNASGRVPGVDGFETCGACGGTGTKLDNRPHGAPAILPVASSPAVAA